jgi:hypothetical protein
MKKASDYRQHALECRTLATQTKIEEHRQMLLNMAETWEMLADGRSRLAEATDGSNAHETGGQNAPDHQGRTGQ